MSSYKNNIIKSEGVVFKGIKPLKTTQKIKDISSKQIIEEDENINSDLKEIKQELEVEIENARKIHEEIIQNTELEKSNIIQMASDEANDIKKKAYEEGHSQGLQNGYEDGYKEAYEENIQKAKLESEKIIQEATDILLDSKQKVAEYMKNNRNQIIELSITIAEKVLKDKFEEVDSMNKIIDYAIREYETKENFVVKVNSIYLENINAQIETLKNEKFIKGEAFVIEDNSVSQGNAIIETNKGRLIVGVDSVLEKVKEELL